MEAARNGENSEFGVRNSENERDEDARALREAPIQERDGNFKTRVNANGVYLHTELIELEDDRSPYWTGGLIYGIFSMDDTEFSQFYQQVKRLSKDLPPYGEGELLETEEKAVLVENEKGKQYLYQISLDGFMHGVILSKIDLRKYEKKIGGTENGRTAADTLQRIGESRENEARNHRDNRGAGKSGRSIRPSRVAGTKQGHQSGKNNERIAPTDAQSDEGLDPGVEIDTQLQERDGLPTDRELLMEAAEAPRASVEVKDYAQKVKAMERA